MGNTAVEIKEIMNAEIVGGKRLASVGFIRRFDQGYRNMKALIQSREMEEPLIAYCAHRNTGDWVGHIPVMNDACAVVGTAIHEIDVISWLFDEPFVSAQALMAKSTSSVAAYEGFRDTVILNMKTQNDIMVMLEVNMACQYGYEIQCQVVSERGIAKCPSRPLQKSD